MSKWTVRAWMSSTPCVIDPKESLQRARALLRTAKVAELLVVDNGRLVGTLSERDLWEHCPTGAILLGDQQADELLAQMRVGGVMTLHPPTVTPDTSLREAVQLFATSKKQGLPVVEDGVPIGFLSEDRVMQAMALLLDEWEQSAEKKGEQ
jgi:acetoin utilization protein AcuB